MADREQTTGEEIANSLIHGVGAAMSVAALVVLVAGAAWRGNAWAVTGCAVFGSSLVLLYLSSTMYHALTHSRAKRVFRILDHSSIYLLIAGTYTPFALVTLRGAWGWTLFGVVWGLAAAGIVFQCFLVGRLPVLSTAVYVGMGWLAVVAARPLMRALEWSGIWWLVGGGVLYTMGVWFFASRRKYAHAVWHAFVVAGSACHVWAVWRYVARN